MSRGGCRHVGGTHAAMVARVMAAVHGLPRALKYQRSIDVLDETHLIQVMGLVQPFEHLYT
jgi:hypothetical protein